MSNPSESLYGLSLCTGYGGLELGLRLRLGFAYRLVGAFEKKKECRHVLWSNRDFFGGGFFLGSDFVGHDFREWRGVVDILSAGYPCQGFSTASRGRPTHPDMWPEVLSVVESVEPRFVFLENVNQAPWSVVRQDLERRGYRVRLGEFCSGDYGAPHNRKRTFLLADADRNVQPVGSFHAKASGVPETSILIPHPDRNTPRVDDGTTRGVDRRRMLGEGVVPMVASYAFGDLMERLMQDE